MVLLALGNVAVAEEQEPTIKLKILATNILPSQENPSPTAQAGVAVLKAFRKKFPHIEPVLYSGVEIEGQVMDSRVLMAIAGKMAPDILYVNFRQSDTYIGQGFLYPLDEFMVGISEEALAKRVPENVWPVIKRKGPNGEEGVWALPFSFLVRALWYRKDVFKDAGLDPDRPPRDWKEFKEYAKQLTNPEKGTYGIGFYLSGQALAWEWMSFLWSAGGEAMVQDENGEWWAAFNDDAAAEAAIYYAELVGEKWKDARGKERQGYCYRGDTAIMRRLLGDGKIGMYLQYMNSETIGSITTGNPDAFGIAPVPLGPTGLRGAEINCQMMGIFSGIGAQEGFTVEQVRRAAWEFIWFWDSEEARRVRTRVLVEGGLGRFVNPLNLKKFGYDEYLKYIPQEYVETFEIAVKSGKPEPYGKNCQAIYSFMGTPLEKIINRVGRDDLGDTRAEKLAEAKAILTTAVNRTNEEMIGRISPAERRKRNSVAFIVAVFVFALFAAAVVRIWKIFTPEEAVRKGGWRFGRYKWAYIILLPAVLSILIWQYTPMLMGSLMVVQDYRVVGDSSFVGMGNIADALWNAAWWKSLLRTLYYMFLTFTLGFWTPIALAILLHEVSHFKIFYRTVYYLPAVLTGFVVIYLWKLFFDPTDMGLLNQLLNLVGVSPLGWLRDDRLAMICCIVPTVWAGMGPGCLIYLAALKAVPDDLYEAADIDGAGFCGKIRHITLPTLKAIIIIQFIAIFISSAQGAGWILVMSGTREVTKVAGLYIWEQAYMFLRFGTAVTMAWIFGVSLLIFTTQQLKILSRMEFRAAGTKV